MKMSDIDLSRFNSDSLLRSLLSPFDSLLSFYLLGLVLSCCIILCLVGLEVAIRKFDIITMAFHGMFKVDRRRLRCFNVDITVTEEYRVVRASCIWMLRIVVATILCFLWQSCIMFQRTWNMKQGRLNDEKMSSLCSSGLACVYYQNVYGVYILWTKKMDFVDICGIPEIDNGDFSFKKHIDFSRGYLTCAGIVPMDSLSVVVQLAVSYALFRLVTGMFQILAFCIFRSSGLDWCYAILSFILFMLYFFSLFFPHLFFLDTWFASASYLALPLTLLCARAAGLATRQRLNKQLVLVDVLRMEEMGLDTHHSALAQIMKPNAWISVPSYSQANDSTYDTTRPMHVAFAKQFISPALSRISTYTDSSGQKPEGELSSWRNQFRRKDTGKQPEI